MAFIKTCLKPPMSIISASGSICTFNALQEGLPLKSHKVALTATQSGSGTPSPDNVRTINGWSAINIAHCGNNFISNSTDSYNLLGSNSHYYDIPNIHNFSGQTMTFKLNTTGMRNKRIALYCSGSGFNSSIVSGEYDSDTVTFTMPSETRPWRLRVYVQPYDATEISISGAMLSFNSLPYEDFNGTYTTINLGGTYYGGEYDARTRVFTVTDKIINLGNLSWSASGSNFVSPYFNLTDTNIKPPATNNDVLNGMCEVLNLTSYNSLSDKCIALSSGKNLFARNSDYIDATDFKNSVTGYYLKYPLATPTTIQLPPCPIDTLLGENNIWADTGNTSLEAIKIGR